ncbi:MAG: adaptor protein MecA [Roseburia hominis]|uniref:adaptor protein MecA n=1 Tax=Roseburia hominis TaxID=301301 RepID=UPI0026EBA979|nr:adaptor protein MecA [Roseburia hominis]MCI7523625.1 adaptor protein MecA [Roseburia hominis]MDD6241718.1 adaptor protein MecA [Roseburia hominis]
MEIEHIGDNKIRCALTEQEIESLGYDIDEIIANSEITQKFMHTVLELVEEQEHIQMEGIFPMVKAELLQDHSMAITFGADKEVSLKDLVNTVSHMISQLDPDAALGKQAKAEKGNTADAAASSAADAAGARKRTDPMICALRFASFENMRRMSLLAFRGKIPKSSLYKMDGAYYLILDFTGFAKEEMRPFAFGTIEYDDAHYSDQGHIAHIKEQGICIMKKQALEMLMQL